MSLKIKLVRIDNRLLHATVALNWNSFVNSSHIIVVDPEYENDAFMAKVLQLSLPPKTKINIVSIDSLKQFIRQAENEDEKYQVIILFKKLSVLYQAFQEKVQFQEVQFPYPASRLMLKSLNSYFSKTEIAQIRIMQQAGIKFYFQTTPMDSKDYNAFNEVK
jgi:D-glucosaminate-specific PTS system IIB component